MGIKPIKLDNEITDPVFMEISVNARKAERNHLLGLLRILTGNLKKQKLPPAEIYAAIERWADARELTTKNGD